MTVEILLAIGLVLILMLPSILLIEGSQKDLAEENNIILFFKLNILETIFSGFISILYTSLGLSLIYTSLNSPDEPVFLKILITSISIIFVIDFPLFLNHLIQVKSQSVVIDKEKDIVLIKKSGKKFIINLKNDNYDVIRYEPRWPGSSIGRPPGLDLGKTVILKDNIRVELSDLLLRNYNLFSWLNEKEDRTIILRYFNFIK